MTIYQLIYSSLYFILPYVGLQVFENKIEGVACGVLLANVLNLISGLYLTYYATNSNQQKKIN